MKVRSNIRAGNEAEALRKCQKERDYWKVQAAEMEAIATSPAKPSPPQQPTPPPSYGTATTVGCGWVNGIYYPDLSGTCG